MQSEMRAVQFHLLKMWNVPQGHQTGKELSDDCGNGRASNSHTKRKDKNRIQNGVDNCSYQHTGHGIFGTSVCSGKIADAVCDNQKRHSHGGDPCVV